MSIPAMDVDLGKKYEFVCALVRPVMLVDGCRVVIRLCDRVAGHTGQ